MEANREIRREALRLLAQVEKQGLDITERYRRNDGLPQPSYRHFRDFIEHIDHFHVFVDLVEERLPGFEPAKRDALARHLAEIRWRIIIVEVDTTQVFLVRIGESGRPWPLGSRQFLERRLVRLGEFVAYHDAWGEAYHLPPLGEALLMAVEDLLKAQIERAPALVEFHEDPDLRLAATPSRPSTRRRQPAGLPAARPQPAVPRRFAVRELAGRFYVERDSIVAVSEACRRARLDMDQLASKLGMSRPALVLILSGTDPVPGGTLDSLRSFVESGGPDLR